MSFFHAFAKALGGAAKALASGVTVAAKFSGKAFTDVSGSTLWKIVAGAAPFVLPGIGLAVSAGMVTAAAIGKAGSVKDAVLAAARGGMSLAGQAGFDVGTGLAIHGEGMTGPALEAIRSKIPNGDAKAGFDAALAIQAGRRNSTAPAPAHLSPAAKATYYSTKGLAHVGAPPAMKKAVTAKLVGTPGAEAGLHAAIEHINEGKEESVLQWLIREAKTLVYRAAP